MANITRYGCHLHNRVPPPLRCRVHGVQRLCSGQSMPKPLSNKIAYNIGRTELPTEIEAQIVLCNKWVVVSLNVACCPSPRELSPGRCPPQGLCKLLLISSADRQRFQRFRCRCLTTAHPLISVLGYLQLHSDLVIVLPSRMSCTLRA